MSNESPSFSVSRRAMLEDLTNAAVTATAEDILGIWSHHYTSLEGSRGLFCVNELKYQNPSLPGDHSFADRGFLLSWMASNRLLLIQNKDGARNFRYWAPIFCDTNFVSYCEAFYSGRSLNADETSFRKAVEYLLPIAETTNAFPYIVENADNPNREKVRATIEAFAAFKLTSPDFFSAHGRFVTHGLEIQPSEIAKGFVEVMDMPDFKILHASIKSHYLLARIVLLKATLLFFEDHSKSVQSLFFRLLKFLHDEMARLPQFEIYLAHRFFMLNSQEPFFKSVQRNAKDLDRKIQAMAWDLAHWRSAFQMLAIFAASEDSIGFPVPHFLSFDRPFVRLMETFKLTGLIYAREGKRCEHIFSESVLHPVSELLRGPCHEFYTAEAMRCRNQRAVEENELQSRLVCVEAELANQLIKVTGGLP